MSLTIRKYIRHPSHVPLHYCTQARTDSEQLSDVGEGGVCFTAHQPLVVGSAITVHISVCKPAFNADGIVRWCLPKGELFLVGVAFSEHAIQNSLRMVEQICHIEQYRAEMLASQGIKLSSEEAARQWIAKYAARFPGQLK